MSGKLQLMAPIKRPYRTKQWSDAEYLAKLLTRITVLENGCWEIDGAHFKSSNSPVPGYGAMSYRGKAWPAHRLSYFLHHGTIDAKLDCMHSCDYPPCVNPAHLSLGTRKQNIRDAISRRRGHKAQILKDRTHCPRGHSYAEFGRSTPNKLGWIQRACTICQRIKCRRIAGWPTHLLDLPAQPLGQKPRELIEWRATQSQREVSK